MTMNQGLVTVNQGHPAAGRPTHGPQRVMGKLLVGAVKSREKAIARVADSKLREELFSFQIGIAGKANAAVDWQPAECRFPAPMVAAPLQRDSELDVPQFWVGSHLYVSEAPVVIVAHVATWIQDDADYTIGASLMLGAYTPAQDNDVDYSGYVHASFQGYSGPALDDDDQGVT